MGFAGSADGSTVASVTRDPTRVWVGDIDTTNPELLYEADNPIAHMQWSSDAEKLAITECFDSDGCGIVVVSVDDGSTIWRAEPQINHLDWHPENPNVFSYATAEGVFMVDLSDGSDREIANHDGLPEDGEQFAQAYRISDDELIAMRYYSYGETPPDAFLWRISVDEGIDPESGHHIGWAFDIDLLTGPDGSVGILIARYDEHE